MLLWDEVVSGRVAWWRLRGFVAYGVLVVHVCFSGSWKFGCLPLVSSQVVDCAPRARGDGPPGGRLVMTVLVCSPRTRGWSHTHSAPRARGDGPTHTVLPAHAGMVPSKAGGSSPPRSAPRARGDGPVVDRVARRRGRCSPRTRGWSQEERARRRGLAVLPAHAGMVPGARTPPTLLCRAPRARGDGPQQSRWIITSTECSPRTRGWSQTLGGEAAVDPVLPAHAGMVPPRAPAATACTCAPRAHGGGPLVALPSGEVVVCSPRTRRWSQV